MKARWSGVKHRFRPVFGSLRAGEALWDRIAEVLRQPSPNPAVLTCYHRVIALGFQGLYSLKAVSQSQRDEVVKALSERVSPPDAGLSLVVYRIGKHRWSLMRSVWFWIVLAVILTGIIWWGPSVASGAVVSTNTGAAWLMRRKVIISVGLHTLAAVAALLWLLWYFIPTGNVFKGLSTLLILLLAGWYVFKTVGMRSPYPTHTSRRLNCHYSTLRAPLYWCVATCWMRCFREALCVKQPGMVATGRRRQPVS